MRCNIRCFIVYRRGVSYLSLGEADKAEADLVTAARLEPGNRAVQVSLLLHPHLHHSSSFTATGAAGAGQEEEEERRQGYGQQAGQNVQLIRSGLSFVPKNI